MSIPARRILDYIDQNQGELVQLLQTLVQTRSVNPWKDQTSEGEYRVAAIIEERLVNLGFAVESFEVVQNRPNLVARLKGSGSGEGEREREKGREGGREAGGEGPSPGRRLLVNAHMDTHSIDRPDEWIADPFGAEIIDGKIYGRGTCDHKSPIAAMLFAIQALQDTGVELNGDLTYVFDSDEEGGGRFGMRHVIKRFDLACDYALYACTTDIDEASQRFFSAMGEHNIIRALSGSLHLAISVQGQVYHPLTPKMDRNAVETAAKLMPFLEEERDRANSFTDPVVGSGHQRMSISFIECGPREDRQADECKVHLLRRVDPSEDIAEVEAKLVNDIERWLKDTEITATVETIHRVPTVTVPEDSLLVRELRRAAVEATGIEPRVTGMPTPVGISQMLASVNVPTVLFGYGLVNLHHAVNEHIAVEDLVNTAKVYALAIGRLLQP